MWGKNKVALHSLDYRRERFAGLVPISSADPNTPYGPIGVETRLGHLSLHDDPDKRFTGRVSLLHGLGDRQLQIIARDRIAVVGRFPLRKPSQNGVSSNKKWLIYKPPIAQNSEHIHSLPTGPIFGMRERAPALASTGTKNPPG